MKILAVEHELCKSRELFEIMMQQIAQSDDDQRRADQVERELFCAVARTRTLSLECVS